MNMVIIRFLVFPCLLFIFIINQAYSKEKNPLTFNIESLTENNDDHIQYPKSLNGSNNCPMKGIDLISSYKQDSIQLEQPPAIKPGNNKKVIPEGDREDEEIEKEYRKMEKHKGWDFMYDPMT